MSRILKRQLQVVFVSLLVCFNVTISVAQAEDPLKSLYDLHEWFRLRDVTDKSTPEFYRGVVAAISNNTVGAEKYLTPIINSTVHSEQTIDAYSFLTQLYMR